MLLVEDLKALVAAAGDSRRHPSLETLMARGRVESHHFPTPNHLRFHLFGIDQVGDIAVAALTRVADTGKPRSDQRYWLRVDPVTLWADMTRVFMTGAGFADMEPSERDEIENVLRRVLEAEGIDLHGGHPERWCLPLNDSLPFRFPDLDEALGMDQAEALPEHEEAKFWRRLLGEIQIALHHCPANMRRRAEGRQEINSVWFWGGGFIPDSAPHEPFDTVYSDHPVTSGLALINDASLKTQVEAARYDARRDGTRVLIDWQTRSRDAQLELNRLEREAALWLELASQGDMELELFCQDYRWRLNRSSLRRFWRRRRPLAVHLPGDAA